ncbi:MAG: arginine deiminase-related protein [Candidatus Poseidoniia archaeon]|jgi:dimethylargininase|nr:arginine deiminase-related protein [Candidatus Poseidoniia archaeon]HJL81657.1 arginine deiminase-related protein [Gammaproteobacteria bacterium]
MTREINAAMGSCELTFLLRDKIDMDLAKQQHQQYQSVLSSLGCEIVIVSTESNLADSVFIEDTAVVLDEIAVLCRPATALRGQEVAGVKDVLQQYRTLASIQSPGTLEGGDLLRVGNIIYAGLSTRSNQSGIEQLRYIVADYGFSVESVETKKCLHLKSAVSEVAPGVLLINSDWISRSVFKNYELIDVDKEEAHAANALLVDQKVIYPSSFPRTLEKLVNAGLDVTQVNVSELQKAEGAVTCCSLIFKMSL